MRIKKVYKQSMLFFTSTIAVAFVIIVIFIRSSIEVGEERIWIFVYLFIVPPILTLFIWFFLSNYHYIARLFFSVSTFLILVLILIQIPLFADKIYENPERFCFILPAILRAEKLYLEVFPVDTDRYRRHNEKAYRWKNLRKNGECM